MPCPPHSVIVYEGDPGVEATANAPQSLLTGMNKFLQQLEITFRRDPSNFRPRINKMDSVKDREQKSTGCVLLGVWVWGWRGRFGFGFGWVGGREWRVAKKGAQTHSGAR